MIPQFVQDPKPYDFFRSNNYIVLDFETTNIEYGNAAIAENDLLLACWKKHGDKKVQYLWADEYHVDKLLAEVEKADYLVAQNAKMELKWLARAGLDLTKVMVFDTMLAEKTMLGNRRQAMDLGSLAKKYGHGEKEPYVDLMLKRKHCPSVLPKSMVLDRCARDVLQTERVFLAQRRELYRREQLPVAYTKFIANPCLADMEMNGLVLDEDRVNAEYDALTTRAEEVEAQLRKETGGINLNSRQQLGAFLYEELGIKEPADKDGNPARTPAGGYATSADVLKQLRGRTKRQKEFINLLLERNKLHDLLSKAIKKFKECVDNGDILYALFNQHVTQTHRLSSTGVRYGVQFQNLPRSYKPMFRARNKGWYVGEIDGAQLEFRVADYLGQDRQGYDDIINEVDVHGNTAQILTESGQDTDRQGAKAHTFKPLYGGMSGTKAERAYYQWFKERYAGIARAQDQWKNEVLANKYLRLPTGMQFFWPDTKQQPDGFITNSTSICNYPVQYLATAEIIPVAVVYLWHYLKDRDFESFLINTVHDSAIMEIEPTEVDDVYELSHWCFTDVVYWYLEKVYGIKFNVPLGTGFKAGEHWSEGEEIKAQVEPKHAAPA